MEVRGQPHAPAVLQRRQSRCQVNRRETKVRLHAVAQGNVPPPAWTQIPGPSGFILFLRCSVSITKCINERILIFFTVNNLSKSCLVSTIV